MDKLSLPLETPSHFGDYKYPTALEIMEKQQDIYWTAKEIPVEKDIHDFRHVMSPEQYALCSTTLTTFVELERDVGNVWSEIETWFPHSEIEGLCSQFASMEKSVHAFFYQKMSDEMNIDPETIAKDQENIAVLKNKLALIKDITKNLGENKMLSLATVALIEQVLLFSNFAMLKSFQANGHNLITNTITGVDFVVQDEQLHGVAASFLHNTLMEERNLDSLDIEEHTMDVMDVVDEIVTHELAVIQFLFQGVDSINDITADQLISFIFSRVDQVLHDLGLPMVYNITDNPIANWFYKGAKSIKLHDFFVSGTSSYRRGWSSEALTRLPHLKEGHVNN